MFFAESPGRFRAPCTDVVQYLTSCILVLPRVPEECPEQIAQLYVACLSEEPGQRPKAADLVKIITAAQEAVLKRSLSSRLTGRGSRLWPSRHGGSQ